MDDSLDPVVQEVPVVLSTEMLRQVYVLQQHMRSASASAAVPSGAEFREVNETLTVQYEMDKRSANYNPDAEEWNQVDTLDFECHPAPMRTHYVVGSLVDGACGVVHAGAAGSAPPPSLLGKLHVAPVHGMYQMRPTLTHVDAGVPNLYADKAKASASGAITQVEVGASSRWPCAPSPHYPSPLPLRQNCDGGKLSVLPLPARTPTRMPSSCCRVTSRWA